MIKHQVRIPLDAERDVEDLYDYIAREDAPEPAHHVVDELERLITSLEHNPERGVYPPELSWQGIKDYREVFFKPYRIIYEIRNKKVIVHLCVDGRRDMKTLLERRMFRSFQDEV